MQESNTSGSGAQITRCSRHRRSHTQISASITDFRAKETACSLAIGRGGCV